jgi:hypothetical protein
MNGVNLLVFSDFNYGCLPQIVVDKITIMAKAKGIIDFEGARRIVDAITTL